MIIPILLQLAAVAVIIAEIILPSGGILSIIAVGLIGFSLYHVFTQMVFEVAMGFVIADLILIPLLIYWGLRFMAKSPVTLHQRLSSEDGATVQSSDQKDYLGRSGTAITDLRPSGVAMIDKERLDVVTQGEYIEKQASIVVIAVRGNQIVVELKPPSPQNT